MPWVCLGFNMGLMIFEYLESKGLTSQMYPQNKPALFEDPDMGILPAKWLFFPDRYAGISYAVWYGD